VLIAKMYFGYTRCPDICPDELDKMSEVIDMVKSAVGDVLMPVMVTCDPLRDPPDVIKKYLEDFHPEIIGLTGTHPEIKRTCKEYRVYFSTPPEVKPGEDYLVDHSIYFFLMGKLVDATPNRTKLTVTDPEGDFVEVLGRNFNAKEAAKVIIDHVRDWDGFLDQSPRRRGWAASKLLQPKAEAPTAKAEKIAAK
jgi:protein SCO1